MFNAAVCVSTREFGVDLPVETPALRAAFRCWLPVVDSVNGANYAVRDCKRILGVFSTFADSPGLARGVVEGLWCDGWCPETGDLNENCRDRDVGGTRSVVSTRDYVDTGESP